MSGDDQPRAETPAEDYQEVVRRAHHRLRKASQELEALVAPRSMRGRWEPVSAPPAVIETVRSELASAYDEVDRLHAELVDGAVSGEVGGPEERT